MVKTPIYNVLHREKVSSTNSELRFIMDTQPDFTVLVADYQEQGRGQGDHKWHSARGCNLTFSILTRYKGERSLKAADQQLLTMASSLAVIDFLDKYGVSASIKKPNDIYAAGGKICGMLIENGISGASMQWSIIGIGVNVNECEFPEELPAPMSLKMLIGGEYELKKCLRDFLKHFSVRFDAIWTDPDGLKSDYENRLI